MPRLPRLRKGVSEAPQAPEATTADPETAGGSPAPAAEEPRADAAPAPSGDPLRPTTPSGETGSDGEAAPATTSRDPLGGTAEEPSTEPPTTSGDPLSGTGGETSAEPTTSSGDPLSGAASAPTAGDAPTTSGDPLGGATTSAPSADPGVEQATVVAPAAGETVVEAAPADAAPGFRTRARIRRRLRYLRRYRELAFRDLGGLVFDLHRFGRERPDLVAQKLGGLATVDRELRALETALRDRQDITQLREAGIAACTRCQTLHDTDANFCPGCGSALRGAVVRDAAPVTVTPAEPGAPS
jgi:hypothetical protein